MRSQRVEDDQHQNQIFTKTVSRRPAQAAHHEGMSAQYPAVEFPIFGRICLTLVAICLLVVIYALVRHCIKGCAGRRSEARDPEREEAAIRAAQLVALVSSRQSQSGPQTEVRKTGPPHVEDSPPPPYSEVNQVYTESVSHPV